MKSARPRRTGGGKVLKSWSMSTGVVVEERPSSAPSSSGRVAVRPGADRDVVVGDARERGGADHRRRALVQLLFDFDLDLGQVVVGELDAFDRADRRAADQDLVVRHELAGVLENERVLVAAVAAEEDEGEDDHRDREGRDDRDSGAGDPPACGRAFLLA